MERRMIARVAVERSTFRFDKLFDYAVPEEMIGRIKPGSRVLVPFGRANKKMQALVFELGDTGEVDRAEDGFSAELRDDRRRADRLHGDALRDRLDLLALGRVDDADIRGLELRLGVTVHIERDRDGLRVADVRDTGRYRDLHREGVIIRRDVVEIDRRRERQRFVLRDDLAVTDDVDALRLDGDTLVWEALGEVADIRQNADRSAARDLHGNVDRVVAEDDVVHGGIDDLAVVIEQGELAGYRPL